MIVMFWDLPGQASRHPALILSRLPALKRPRTLPASVR